MTVFDLPGQRSKSEKLTEKTLQPGFWEGEDARDVSRELASVQSRLDKWKVVEDELGDLETLAEMLSDADDAELLDEFYERAASLEKNVAAEQIYVLLSEEYDISGAIVTVHAGAGGLDSQDWCEMLYRMYLRWAESHGFSLRLLDEQRDQEAGIKSVTFEARGDFAYGYLKGEQGVHRLVRISPFDSAHRRHTSFSSVEVLPVLPDSVEVEIRPEDLRTDTFRSSGAGGQHVNMTDSAVRITHVPTGVVVTCQDERSQIKNRAKAMQLLRTKLYDVELRKQQDAMAAERKGQVGSGDRSERIRTYNFPQNRVTDHRIGLTLHKLDQVIAGDLDELIEALTMADQAEKMKHYAA